MIIALTHARPDLAEQWTEQGDLDWHAKRLARNAMWLWEEWVTDDSTSTHPVTTTGRERIYAIDRALWLATQRDLDQENQAQFDPVVSPSAEDRFDQKLPDELLPGTSLPSNWL